MKVYVAWWGTDDHWELIGAAASFIRAQQVADDWFRAFIANTRYMQGEEQWAHLAGEWAQRPDDTTVWERTTTRVSWLRVNEIDVVQDQEGN
jgi:hypothetical protein